jgi:hypothetical protein
MTRADKIFELLKTHGGRLRVFEIFEFLVEMEGSAELQANVISSTVHSDNRTRKLQGRAPRFNRYGDGTEEYGFVSIRNLVRLKNDLPGILKKYELQIPSIIEKANFNVRQQLKDAIRKLTWKEFETNFLSRILEVLGFQTVEITQTTRDNGTDAYCTYKRGLVISEAIVSAKHWTLKVGKNEIQRLRGIKGPADTGIIVTSAAFTREAIKEAKPSQNQRAIVLIDADIIVETCINHSIGVKCIALPKLYKFTELNYINGSG